MPCARCAPLPTAIPALQNSAASVLGLFGGAEKPRARKPSARVMEEEEILMQALADEEEDVHPGDGAIEIDSDEEYHVDSPYMELAGLERPEVLSISVAR
ncbi:hypothetical protein B0H10DRAFT_2214756 [Mycena sp. CBHHK59/15]|nr:hypothetical protein B0H10DRAFT_2214756 [Mycena sp. CBHHK59/15]